VVLPKPSAKLGNPVFFQKEQQFLLKEEYHHPYVGGFLVGMVGFVDFGM
jgi:hypothetical protein